MHSLLRQLPWRRNRLSAAPSRPSPLGRLGTLEVRLAQGDDEIRSVQKLRYHVFYEEMSAIGDLRIHLLRRDLDAFDAVCDHLLVLDNAGGTAPRGLHVVGSCRLLRQDVAKRGPGFYSASEFDTNSLVARHHTKQFLEVGRSCVLLAYRHRRTIELLWHGIWAYVRKHQLNAMIGCASLFGTDPDRLALPLSFLHHYASAPEPWRVEALPHLRVAMNRMPGPMIDVQRAMDELPPLIKGYIRLGGFVGDGAVVDHRFGTTDVFMVVPIELIGKRYVNYFGLSAERYAK
jgi:putative hemolysin